MTKSFKHVSDLAEAGDRPTYLAIGVFDGVHLGHQRLLQNMVTAAQKVGARPAVLTFYPHPVTVVQGRKDPLYICTLEDRINLMADQGLELVVTQFFDEEIRQTRAAKFVDQLHRNLDLKQLWGGNFGLGYNREGDLPFLRQLGREIGFTVHQFEAMIQWDGQPVSSSRIRQGLRNGDMNDVTGCLGRSYRLTGTVIRGDGRGRQLGIPTANLDVWDEQLLPANGVYAAYAWLDDHRYKAATNIGIRPTVNGHSITVEAHLLDFDADIYGQKLTLDFVTRIRDEKKFPDLEALINQIQADINQVRTILEPVGV